MPCTRLKKKGYRESPQRLQELQAACLVHSRGDLGGIPILNRGIDYLSTLWNLTTMSNTRKVRIEDEDEVGVVDYRRFSGILISGLGWGHHSRKFEYVDRHSVQGLVKLKLLCLCSGGQRLLHGRRSLRASSSRKSSPN